MANEVTLTFAGNPGSLPGTMADIGSGAQEMGDKVTGASKSFTDAGSGFDTAAEGFDRVEQRAMGFRDTLTGVQDSVKGFGSILKGDFSGDALLAAGMGVGDLASGFSNFLVPAMKDAVGWLGKTKVGMAVATAAQWAWNIAIGANPIGLIIIAVAALIAIIVLLVLNWDKVKEVAGKAWDWIKDKAIGFWNWIKDLPDKIGDAFGRIGSFIMDAMKAAFNFVSNAWNNTIGKLSWTVPTWVPFIGGNTISAPQLPTFHTGISHVPRDMVAFLQRGERVTPASGSGTEGTTLVIPLTGSRFVDALIRDLADGISSRGGSVQVVLGRGHA